MDTITCRRCQRDDAPALDKAPFPDDLGRRVTEEICENCWEEWKRKQMLLINHYGLDPRDAKSREFLYGQIESVLFGEGETEEVDTSKKGEIDW
ncbi:MAG: oxidative damage protection protein [Gemmatimonadetes bacterium]|nr:oxidative damage protection protein [Gemmatimonadota bacterium]